MVDMPYCMYQSKLQPTLWRPHCQGKSICHQFSARLVSSSENLHQIIIKIVINVKILIIINTNQHFTSFMFLSTDLYCPLSNALCPQTIRGIVIKYPSAPLFIISYFKLFHTICPLKTKWSSTYPPLAGS